LFASVLVDGRGYFLQNGQKVWLEPGDAVLYATDQPYLFGFSKPMRQILVDLDLQTAQCKGWPRLHGPVLVGQNRRLDRYDMMSFVSILTKFVQLPVQSQANCVAASVQSLIGRAVGTTVSRGRDSTAQLRYARAKAFISERAANPGFDREQLAAFMGMSLRTLERLFVQFGSTLTEAVWQQRLEKARDLLTMPSTQTLPIAEIAGRSGFVSQAHFSTAFRRFYGVSPRQFREQCLVVK
jgi:AraC-like DNA-binding protein